MIARETLQTVHGFVETNNGGFGFGAHDLFGEENAEFAQLRKHGVNASAGFGDDDDGKRIAANVKVRDFLRYAIVGDEKVLLVEVVDHGAALIAHGDGSGNESDAGGEFGEDLWRSLLDLRVGERGLGALGSLSEGGTGDQQQENTNTDVLTH